MPNPHPLFAVTAGGASSVMIHERADGMFRVTYYRGDVEQKDNVFKSLGHAKSDAKDWMGGDDNIDWQRIGPCGHLYKA